jgi:hypothetical protein
MRKKKICKVHTLQRSLLAERKVVESWLCLFFDDVFCPYPKVSRENRAGSVCLGCQHYANFEREMDEEDERIMDEIDEIRRTGVWK